MQRELCLRTMVIVNPASAAGGTARRWDRTARVLQRALGRFEHAFTDAPRHATRLTAQALEEGFELVVAVGGDGTLNEVACGFFRGRLPVSSEAVLGVIPQGTGCDFVRVFGTCSVDQACARLAQCATRRIDVGYASFVSDDGRTAERIFLNVASFGVSARVAHTLGRHVKRAGARLAFALATLGALRAHRDQAVTIVLDDEVAFEQSITNCALCNGQYFGGGMRVAPRAEIDDGCLDITIWSGFGLVDFIRKRRALYNGTHIHERGTRLFRVSKARATSAEDVLLELDGEGVGRLPVSIEIFPRVLRLRN